MKVLLSVAVISTLIGCTPRPPQQIEYVLPEELKHCKVLRIESASSPDIYTIVCPKVEKSCQELEIKNSTWQSSSGRTSQNRGAIMINGIEYKKVENDK